MGVQEVRVKETFQTLFIFFLCLAPALSAPPCIPSARGNPQLGFDLDLDLHAVEDPTRITQVRASTAIVSGSKLSG